MIISNPVWEAAYFEIEEERKSKLKRLLSGNCEQKEYSAHCGFLQGLEFFEEKLKEAKNPNRKEEDNGRDDDAT